MITSLVTTTLSPPSVAARALALRAATVLRDCSFRRQSTALERRSCRALMREQALFWRRPAPALSLG
jgi:hypothetical protein